VTLSPETTGLVERALTLAGETQGAFDNFVNSGWEFGGQATLTAQAAGQGGGYAGAIPVSPGVWIYQLTGDGLAASITVKGSKYYKADDLN
jgi:lipid-binding SYLF domain-containing protein